MYVLQYSQNKRRLACINKYWQQWIILLLLVLGLYQMASGLWIFAKAQLAQYLIGQAWQYSLIDKGLHRPWPWADTYPIAELKSKHHKWYVLAGANGRNLAFGPTHVSATALPGTQGNAVILGHRDTQFNSLKTLKKGDIIEIKNLDGRSQYQVTSLHVMEASDLQFWQMQEEDASQYASLTLITCYPFDSIRPNPSQRFVVTTIKI